MSPFSWLPDWVFLGFVLVAALFGIALLFMPFSVFGIKPRLAEVELQLADLRAEIRAMSLRLAAQGRDVQSRDLAVDRNDVGADVAAPAWSESRGSYDAEELRPTHGYMDPPSLMRRSPADYEDSPVQHEPEQILRPTRFDPPARERGWSHAPWEEQGRHQRAREELSPRDSDRDIDSGRRDYRPSRAEPTLRWPPRPD